MRKGMGTVKRLAPMTNYPSREFRSSEPGQWEMIGVKVRCSSPPGNKIAHRKC